MTKVMEYFFAWLGAVLAIGVIAYLAHTSGNALLMAPLGASAVLAFGVPDSPLAQPRSIIGGHFVSAVTGLALMFFLGTSWWVAPVAVGTAIVLMQMTKTTHPPAGANPLIIHAVQAPWSFAVMPVLLSATILAFVAVLFHKLVSRRSYPKFWL